MTTALEQEAAEQGAVEMPPYSSIEFSPQPYQKVVVYLGGNAVIDNEQIDYALERFWHGYLKNQQIEKQVGSQQPQSAPTAAAQRSQAPQGGGGSRQAVYPPEGLVSTLNDAEQWTCDKCHGTGERVARRLKKGRMSGDAIICLNPQCKDGDFRHTITFVEEGMGPADTGQGDINPDDLPF